MRGKNRQSKSLLVTVCNARLTLWSEGGQSRLVLGTAQAGLNFTLHRGEHTVIFGPNGAGKSTLLRLLRGELWLDPQGGSIHWHTGAPSAAKIEDAPLAGRAMTALVSAAQQERYMRQGWDISGEDLLHTGFGDTPLLYTAPEATQRRLVHQLAQTLRLTGLLHRPINTLSQGQLRILLLGRALLHGGEALAQGTAHTPSGPPLLLLDEYTDGLDAPTRTRLLEVLEHAALQSTLVMTSHRADTVPAWVQRRLYLEDGQLHDVLPPAYQSGAKAPASPVQSNSTAPTAAGTALNMHTSATASNKTDDTPPTSPSTSPSTPKPSPPPPLVELRQATVYVDRTPVLHNINWTWRQGEHWLIHGGNGAGKSTLLRVLAGDEYPALGGSIHRHLPRHGGNVTDLERIRRGVRLVSDQLQACYAYDLTGLELVLSGFDNSIGLYRSATEQEKEEALRWMHTLRAQSLEGRRISSLSTGQMRRILLARALTGSPDILLLDEPCSGLDAPSRLELLNILQELATEGVHLALISHHSTDNIPALNRRARMDSGRLHIEQ